MPNYSTILTDKLKSKPAIFTNSITEGVYTNGSIDVAYTIDLVNGTLQKLNLAGNITFTFPTISKDLGSYTITWPVNIKWPNNITPTLSTMDIFSFIAIDGTWYGIIAGQNYI